MAFMRTYVILYLVDGEKKRKEFTSRELREYSYATSWDAALGYLQKNYPHNKTYLYGCFVKKEEMINGKA